MKPKKGKKKGRKERKKERKTSYFHIFFAQAETYFFFNWRVHVNRENQFLVFFSISFFLFSFFSFSSSSSSSFAFLEFMRCRHLTLPARWQSTVTSSLFAFPSKILRLSARNVFDQDCDERETLATQKREERFLLLFCPTTVTRWHCSLRVWMLEWEECRELFFFVFDMRVKLFREREGERKSCFLRVDTLNGESDRSGWLRYSRRLILEQWGHYYWTINFR